MKPPFPGSPAAIAGGCTCDPEANHHGAGKEEKGGLTFVASSCGSGAGWCTGPKSSGLRGRRARTTPGREVGAAAQPGAEEGLVSASG
jgi:hypothetical protein